VVRPEHGGPEPAHALQVAARLVPVLQLVRDEAEVVREPQHHLVVDTEGEVAGGQRVLEERASLRQLTTLTVQAAEYPGGRQHAGVVLPEVAHGGVQGRPQRLLARPGIGAGGGVRAHRIEVVGYGHPDMLP
jgi:hypothetical protein